MVRKITETKERKGKGAGVWRKELDKAGMSRVTALLVLCDITALISFNLNIAIIYYNLAFKRVYIHLRIGFYEFSERSIGKILLSNDIN